jgi:hypothetical protein
VEHLELSDNHLGPEGVAAVALAKLPALRSLVIERVWPERVGVEALFARPQSPGLMRLSLASDLLGPVEARIIAESPASGNLRVLDLSENAIHDAGAIALARSPHLGNVLHLDMRGNDLGAAGKAALRERFGERVAV